ncbi:uncharacterized protein LOC116938422 [Petromyzon marinus]|uniref:Flocculation protein FLO11-like n=1 Tax=Petromyzon marinus TaxID=7757 RepID=A0AAJ7WLZ2_PETMA|nr:flocculation protein FLO11-like [Petromyzon marinus]
MAKRGSRQDSSPLLLDMKIAEPKAQENVKQKIDAVRAIFPNRSKNEVVLVLQHFDYSVDNAVHAFLEGNVSEILGAWNMTKKKTPKKKKSKAQDDIDVQNPERAEAKVPSHASATEPGACAAEAASETCSGVSEHSSVFEAGCDGALKDGFLQDALLSSERRSGTGVDSRHSSFCSERDHVDSGFLENGSDQQPASQPFNSAPLSPGAKKIHFQEQVYHGLPQECSKSPMGQPENAFDISNSRGVVSTHSLICSSTSSDSLPGASPQRGTVNRQTEISFTHHDDRETTCSSFKSNLSAISKHSSSKVPTDKCSNSDATKKTSNLVENHHNCHISGPESNIDSVPPVANVGSQGQQKSNLAHKEQTDIKVGVGDKGNITSLAADTSGGVLKTTVNLDKHSAPPSACREQPGGIGTTITWEDQTKGRDGNSNDILGRGIGVASDIERNGNSPAMPSASSTGTVHVFGPADIYSRREKMLLKRSVSLGTQRQENGDGAVGTKVQLDRRRSNPAKVEHNSQVFDVNYGLEKKATAMSLGDIGLNCTKTPIQNNRDPDGAEQSGAAVAADAPDQGRRDSQTGRRDSQTGRRDSQTGRKDSQTGRRDSQTIGQDSHSVNGDTQPARDSQNTRTDNQPTKSDTSSLRRDSQTAIQESESGHQGSSTDRRDSQPNRRDSQSSRRDSQPSRRDSQSADKDNQSNRGDSQSARRDSQPIRRDSQSTDKDTQSARQDSQPIRRDSQSADKDSQSARRDSQPIRRDSQSADKDSQSARRDSQPIRRDSQSADKDSQSARRDSQPIRRDSQSSRRDSSTAKQESQVDNMESDVSRRDDQSERRDSSQSDRRNSASQRKESNADRIDSNTGRKGSLPGRKNSNSGRRDSGPHSRRDSNPDQKDGKGGRRDSGGSSRKENRRRPGGNVEKSVKDLQRCVVSLNRYQTLLKEEAEGSTKNIKAAFSEITDWLMDREVSIFTELDKVKHEAMSILNARQRKATELKKLCDKNNAAQMSDAYLTDLRAEIKKFVSERKYDEDLGKTAHFMWDRQAVKKMIDTFGNITHPKFGHAVPVSLPVDTLLEASTVHQSSCTTPSQSHPLSAQTPTQVATLTHNSPHPVQQSPSAAAQCIPPAAPPVQLSPVSITQGNSVAACQGIPVANSQVMLGPIKKISEANSEQSNVATTQHRHAPVNQSSLTNAQQSSVATTPYRSAPVNQSSVAYAQQSNVATTHHRSAAIAQPKSALVQESLMATTPHSTTPTTPHSTTPSTPHRTTSTTQHSTTPSTQHSTTTTKPHSTTPTTTHSTTSTTPHSTTSTTPHSTTSTTPHSSTPTTQHSMTAATPHSTTPTTQHSMTAATELSATATTQRNTKVAMQHCTAAAAQHGTTATSQQSLVTNKHNTEHAKQQMSITMAGERSNLVSATQKCCVTPAHGRPTTVASVERDAPQKGVAAPVESKALLATPSQSSLAGTPARSSIAVGSSPTTAHVSPATTGHKSSVTAAQAGSRTMISAQNGPLAGAQSCLHSGSAASDASQAATTVSATPAKVGVARLTHRTGPILGYRSGSATREGMTSHQHNGMPILAKKSPVSKTAPFSVPITTLMASPPCVSQSTTCTNAHPSSSSEANNKPRRTGPIKPKKPSLDATATVPSGQALQSPEKSASTEKDCLLPVVALPQREGRRSRDTLKPPV